MRVVGGTNLLAQLHDAAQVPLWQQLLAQTPAELAAQWVEVPRELVVRDDSTVIVLELDDVVVVGVQTTGHVEGIPTLAGVVALSDSPELARQALPWLAWTMNDKSKMGVYGIATADMVAVWLERTRTFVDRQVGYVDDDAWRRVVQRASQILEASTEHIGPLDVSFRLVQGTPELEMRLGQCEPVGELLSGRLPRGVVTAWQTDGEWSGIGYDPQPFAWGAGDEPGGGMRALLDVMSCEACNLHDDARAWSWGDVPEPSIETAQWAPGLRAREWWMLDPIQARRLVDHVAGWPVRPRTWLRGGRASLVVGWTFCEGGVAATLRAHSPRALATLYVAATRHLH